MGTGWAMRRRLPPVRSQLLDAAAAVLVVAVFWLPPSIDVGDRPLVVVVAGLVLASVTGAAVALRWRYPTTSTVTAGIASVAGTVLGVCQDPMLATAWCLYALVITRTSRTTLVLAVACLLAGLAAVTGVPEGEAGRAGQHGVLAVAALSVALLLGTTVARQLTTAREAERARVQLEVARDVHDVVGHALGVISAEAGVTRGLPDADEQEMRDSLADIEAHARTALEEVQALVRTLRSAPAPLAGSGAAGIAQLPSVIATTRAAGVDVEARIEVDEGIDDVIGAVVFRIVQEALSNVVRHAVGAGCTVDVRGDGDMVVARVRDHGPGARPNSGSGCGLPGVRERARLVGGTATWRNHPGGGFEVEARLPVRGAP